MTEGEEACKQLTALGYEVDRKDSDVFRQLLLLVVQLAEKIEANKCQP